MFTTRKSLLEKIQAGDEESWTDFYESYRGLIYSIGKHSGLNPEDCMDLIQQVMLAVFHGKVTFRYNPELGKFRTYLIGIIKNVLLKMLRSRCHELQYDEGIEGESLEVPDGFDYNAIAEAEWRKYLMQTALVELRNQVSEQTFDVFQMFVLQGQKPEGIAEALGLSLSSVYVYKKRCIGHLREIVEKLRQLDANV